MSVEPTYEQGYEDGYRDGVLARKRRKAMPYSGTRNVNAKLTDAKVREARSLYATGVTITRLAKRYGVHPATIYNAVTGSSWAHV